MTVRRSIRISTVGAIVGVTIALGSGIVIQRHVLKGLVRESLKRSMRSTLIQAEIVRETFSRLQDAGAFNSELLRQQARNGGDFRQTALYQTIPVVAAWQSIRNAAGEQHFQFRVVREAPRNPLNAPNIEERRILERLSSGREEEYFSEDPDTGMLTFARPIRISRDCLTCHGDPATSPTGDGKDVLGFRMEGWKEGEIRGVFILKSDQSQATAAARKAVSIAVAAFVAILAFFVPAFLLANRKLVLEPLHAMSKPLLEASAAAGESSRAFISASEQLSLSATELASAVEEVNTQVSDIVQAARQNSDAARATQSASREASGTAEIGTTAIGQLSEAIRALGNSQRKISTILRTIDEIAFQTNLLALNAAVEAARAGEAGLGFAVVADEVRKLAIRASDAARETETIVSESLEKLRQAEAMNDEVLTRFHEILLSCQSTHKQASTIAEAAEQQSTGLEQINSALHLMNQAIQQIVTQAHGIIEASHRLDDETQKVGLVADGLRRVVD